MMLERTRLDGLPVLEIRVASPEDGPTRLLAELSMSRITPSLVQQARPAGAARRC